MDIRLTPSKLGGFSECPRRAIGHMHISELITAGYELNPDVRGVAMFFGNVVHELLPRSPAARAEEANTLWMTDLWEREVERAKKDGALWEWDKTTPSLSVLVDQAVKACNAIDAATDNAFWQHPDRWAVEQSIRAEITKDAGYEDSDLKIWLSGRFDFYDRWNQRILDIKTGGGYTPGDHGLQLACYRVLLRAAHRRADGGHSEFGEPGKDAHIIFVRRHAYTSRTPDQKPAIVDQYDLRPYQRHAQRQIQTAVQETLRFWRDPTDPDINAIPCNPKSFLCSDKFCRLHGTKACDITQAGARREIQNLPQGGQQ